MCILITGGEGLVRSNRQCWPFHSQTPTKLFLSVIVLVVGALLALLPLPWVVLGIVGVVVVGLILVYPQWGLYLLVFSVPFGSLYEVNLGGITVGASEGLVGLLLIAWFARTAALRSNVGLVNRRWVWPKLSIPLLVFIGTVLFSSLNATALPFFLKELFKWIEFLGVMLFVCNTITEKQSRIVVTCLLLAGLAQAFLGIYQFLTQSGPDFFVLMGRYMRAYGTFEQPNPFAGYLGLIAPLAFAFGVSVGNSSVEKHNWLRWLGLGSFGIIAAAIGMSWSRGAWLAFAAAFFTINLVRSRKGAALFVTLLALLAFLGLLGSFELLPESITQRLTSFLPFATIRDVRGIEVTDENYAVLERLAHWQAALDMWRDHVWFGVGFGNYEAAYAQYALPKWDLPLGHAHNYYLNIAAETGLLGLLAYLMLWATAFVAVVQRIRYSDSMYARTIALGALGMLIHLSAHNVLDNLWVHNLYIHVAIVFGLVFVNSSRLGSATSISTLAHIQNASSPPLHAASTHR